MLATARVPLLLTGDLSIYKLKRLLSVRGHLLALPALERLRSAA
jgi:hypothetical protein